MGGKKLFMEEKNAQEDLQTPFSIVLKQDTGNYIVFKNEIKTYVSPTDVINRREMVKIDFYCRFPKFVSISSSYTVHTSDYIFTESTIGNFPISFEIFHNSNFTDQVNSSSYPVPAKLLETIYMGIQVNSDVPNVRLFVESCKGTPDDDPNNVIHYDLVKDGSVFFSSFFHFTPSDSLF